MGKRFIGPGVGLVYDPSNSLLYGRGVFTTAAVFNGSVFQSEEHWRRLTRDAAKLDIDLSEYSEERTFAVLDDAIAEGGIENGRARITFLDESPSPIWSSDHEKKTGLQIIVAERRPVPRPFRLTTSPYPVNSRSPLAGVKSCNYLEPLLSIEEAQRRGFNEAIRVNESGLVTGGGMANVFWLRKGRLYTPALATGCLAGTTREFVLENIECQEVEATVDEVSDADAIFLTSAGLGVVAVDTFDAKRLDAPNHQILNMLP
jgi:branched-chain amino acid aminotransferase